ncbi:leucine-rich repeats and immunoglobulin-like domains protein 3 [Atheta coriaria]|uniref:leucine-rich repeats and immunoglobulin-like domains protein 3 n=1 Tax=Dalotia coriaria TaxID=877792 RepID=UPI0031F3E7D9
MQSWQFYYAFALCTTCIFGGSSSAASTVPYKPSPAFNCSEPFRNVTALVYADPNPDANFTLYTIQDYRNELQAVYRLDLEPINIIPKLCNGSITKFPLMRHLKLVLTSIGDIEPGSFEDLPKLTHLDLSYNKLQVIDRYIFNNLPLTELRLAGNKIYNIDPEAFDNMTSLALLDLSFNKVQYMDEMWFKNTPKLTTLNFIYNLIPALEAHSFKHLEGTKMTVNLMFMNNSITNIHRDAFKGLKSMGKLWLTGNKLRFIDDQLFNNVSAIDALNLEDNELFCLSERLLKDTRVKEIHLSGNPIICNCMTKLEQWSVQTNTKTYNSAKDLKRCGVSSRFIQTTTAKPEGVLVEL